MTSDLKVFSYSKCGTCRKALKWLKDKNLEFELFDIIENPPSKKYIIEAIDQLGDIKFIQSSAVLLIIHVFKWVFMIPPTLSILRKPMRAI